MKKQPSIIMGYGFIEQTDVWLGKALGVERDSSLFIPRSAANKTIAAAESSLKPHKKNAVSAATQQQTVPASQTISAGSTSPDTNAVQSSNASGSDTPQQQNETETNTQQTGTGADAVPSSDVQTENAAETEEEINASVSEIMKMSEQNADESIQEAEPETPAAVTTANSTATNSAAGSRTAGNTTTTGSTTTAGTTTTGTTTTTGKTTTTGTTTTAGNTTTAGTTTTPGTTAANPVTSEKGAAQ